MSQELNERVCREMGIEPSHWIVTCTENDGTQYRGMFKEEKFFAPLMVYKDFVATPVYPDLLTPEWAGKLLAMLQELGWNVTCYGYQQPSSWAVFLSKNWRAEHAKGDTLPEAVCRAIDALPEGL